MANKKKEVTKAPSGLTITRSENKFTASWKIGDKDYGDGQYLQYSINDTGKDSWQPTADSKKKIGVKTTSKAISIDKDNFYPNKDEKGNNKPNLYEIGFRVKGNRKKYTTGSGKKKKTHSPVSSEWTEERFTVNPPKEPTLTVELDEELTNVCKFSWSAPYASDDSYIFTDTQWQTILVKNNSETDGSKLSWKGSTFDEGTAGAESSKTITEDTAILYRDGNSYTRWFRVRARGPRGVSQDGSYGWVYEKHVYALPNKTNVTGTSAKETDEGGFQCIVDWTVGQSNNQKPIDKVTVQYTIVVPDENLSCPNGASWTDANISRDTADGDAAVFSIDDQLGKDQCLFIRVNTQHDRNITYGKPKLSSVGFLKDPTGLSVQTDNVTHKATINATNVSGVEDSVLVVRYVPAEGDPIDVGVIPHGSSSVTVQCPNWDEQTAIGFEVYAMVGTATKQTREDGVDSYAVTPKMRSQNTVSEGGAVPVAPKEVAVNRVEGKPDTVQVTWDWPWSEAGSAEISWSDHDDAWESTDEPESFLISNLHASKWNISGLETGKTWYIRVRLIAGNVSDSETVTYGPWSDISQGSIDLSSAPNKPVLILSDSIIPEDGSTTASWVYTTTDNTAQAYAEVAVVENGEYIPIAHSLTAQHVTIDAISAGFTVGNVYNLACMVKSASGRNSEWSDVVSLSIAEPLECDIPVSSFVFESTETNPREFTGNPIEFDTELNENIRKLEIALEPTQLGEGTPSPSNVRPIRGHSGVNAYVSPTQSADDGTKYSQEFDVSLTPTSTDKVPYTFKAVGRDVYGDRESDKIVGGTVAWNQLISTSGASTGTIDGITFTNNGNGTWTINGTATANVAKNIQMGFANKYVTGHKMLYLCDKFEYEKWAFIPNGSSSPSHYHEQSRIINFASNPVIEVLKGNTVNNITIHPMVIDLTAMFGATIADYIYSLEQSQAGAGVAWFKKLFPKDYYPYDPGTLRSVEGVSAHETVGFNQWDISTDNIGKAISTDGSLGNNSAFNTSDYIRVIPNATYYFHNVAPSANALTFAQYDSDKNFVKTTSISGATGTDASGSAVMEGNTHFIRCARFARQNEPCINLSDPSRNGEYEPYVKHTYPLDSSLTLRGIPKLADGKLEFDGDVYLPSGEVQRRFYYLTGSDFVPHNTSSAGYKTYKYLSVSEGHASAVGENVISNFTNKVVQTFNSATVSEECIQRVANDDVGKTIYIVIAPTRDVADLEVIFELATPTTESADPYTNPQIVDPSGTEEYVGSPIPVGHETDYPMTLTDTMPTANGTYTLNLTVANGKRSVSWTNELAVAIAAL